MTSEGDQHARDRNRVGRAFLHSQGRTEEHESVESMQYVEHHLDVPLSCVQTYCRKRKIMASRVDKTRVQHTLLKKEILQFARLAQSLHLPVRLSRYENNTILLNNNVKEYGLT